jgi:proline iminopeptidase
MKVELFPASEPYERGMLDVGDGNAISYEVHGSPQGKPAVVLHGGPGQGSSPNMVRAFDPKKWRVVLFDQRGCGRSTPHASVPEAVMAWNTTDHLVSDMEKLRAQLGIERWLVSGGSWGSTLALVYAERHPSRVSAIVLSAVTMSRKSEADWLYRGVGRFFPEAFARFVGHVDGEPIEAYARRMEHPDRAIRFAAAKAWCAWEDAVLSLEPNAAPVYASVSEDEMIAMVRICTHYLRHGAWLEEDEILRDVARLSGIPAILIHGRRDMSCPLETAWTLARAWPSAELVVLEETGHLRSDEKRAALLAAYEKFAG